ncbi:DUF5793 family protein [Halohasta salina]|uniref:DUF5793 family protein n=1 Tax=Halohasta salina TaxID=2961621 RepID=UPI0020A5CD14|nr:DUF5793 family protein [Halohasta salina]
MRREQFDLDVRNIEWVDADADPRQPLARISVTGTTEQLRSRLRDVDGDRLTADMVDVAFRLTESIEEDPAAAGVVGVANRLTGDFIFETNEDADDVLQFINAAREYGRETNSPESRYRIEIVVDDETVTFEKGTFLVYDNDGELLRSRSLIPSGVEL